jgi:hypothetical protein
VTAPAEVAPADVTTTPTSPPAPEPVPPADPAPAAPVDVARPTRAVVKRGRVVSYTFRDSITGAQLDGLGVCVDAPEDGAVCIAPVLLSNYLFVPSGDVQVVELGG